MHQSPVKIFVAMPGTDMGANARYKDPEVIKSELLQEVAEKLKTRLTREVILTIEKDKRSAGVIHNSMFAEASDADVYIADLTGANPNVYLELGVRWALRDRVTILICQHSDDIKFNVIANRVIFYNPDIRTQAIKKIVDAIILGIDSNTTDSPVRLNADYITEKKSTLDELKQEIERLKISRGEDLLHVALHTEKLHDRISILRQVVEVNPGSVIALLELAKAFRGLGQYPDAVSWFNRAIRLNSNDAELYRELGVTYSKMGSLTEAVNSLREAVKINPDDKEAWSNLGGALRRCGRRNAPEEYDEEALKESRDCYNHASNLNPSDHYAGLNVVRLDLLLSKWNPTLAENAKNNFATQKHLCNYLVIRNPNDCWCRFDFAETLLFSDGLDLALIAYDAAVELVPVEQRKNVLSSVLEPLRDYVIANVLDEKQLEGVRAVITRLETVIVAVTSANN